MSDPMVPFARCLEEGCDWEPDLTRGVQQQAEAHTNQSGHGTEAGWIREWVEK